LGKINRNLKFDDVGFMMLDSDVGLMMWIDDVYILKLKKKHGVVKYLFK